MIEVSCSAEIARPPGAVFAFAGDYANDPAWRAGVLCMEYETPGPIAAGTRFTYTLALRPVGIYRVLEPLLKQLIARQVRADVRRLRQRLETAPQ